MGHTKKNNEEEPKPLVKKKYQKIKGIESKVNNSSSYSLEDLILLDEEEEDLFEKFKKPRRK